MTALAVARSYPNMSRAWSSTAPLRLNGNRLATLSCEDLPEERGVFLFHQELDKAPFFLGPPLLLPKGFFAPLAESLSTSGFLVWFGFALLPDGF